MPPPGSLAPQFSFCEATKFEDTPDTCTLFDPYRKRIILFHNNNSTEWHTCRAINQRYEQEVKDGQNLEFWAAILFIAATLITTFACTQIMNRLYRSWHRGNEWKEKSEPGLLKVDEWGPKRPRDHGLRPLLMAVGCVVVVMVFTMVWLHRGRSSVLIVPET